MKRKRTIGNRVWIGLLACSLLVFAALDYELIYSLIYLIAIRSDSNYLLTFPAFLSGTLFATWVTWKALRRRIAILGSEKFLS